MSRLATAPSRPLRVVAMALFPLLFSAVACAQLRVATYNSLQGPNTGFGTIIEAIGEQEVAGIARPIDVLLLQEQTGPTSNPQQTTDNVVALLNGIYGTGIYQRGTLNGGPVFNNSLRQTIVYNSTTVELIGEQTIGTTGTDTQTRQSVRHQLRPLGYDSSADFYIYNSHYKAGDDNATESNSNSSNGERRNDEASAIRSNSDALSSNAHVMYVGDFNMQSSSEQAFQTLLASGNGQAIDPINRLGNWHNNSSFANVHTQSTCLNGSDCPGFASGGVDDRFDFQLVTAEFLDNEGLSYIPGTYRAFGNNGSTYNESINDPSNTVTFPGVTSFSKSTILNALESSSDHLPVIADYQLPAVLEALPGTVPSILAVGESFDLELFIRNAANVGSPNGADELDYVFTTTGDLFGGGSGVRLALDPSDTRSISLDTSTAGLKSGTIVVSTTSQGAANPEIFIPISYQVGGGGGGISEAVIARAVFPAVADDLNVVGFQFAGGFTTEDVDTSSGGTLPVGSDARTLRFGSAGDMFGVEDRADNPPFTIVDDSAGIGITDTLGIVRTNDFDNFFGVVDIENSDSTGPLSAEWSFDISAAVGGLTLSIDLAAMGDFESENDSFLFETSIDGSNFTSAFAIAIDEDGSQTYNLEGGATPSLDDPVVVNGTTLSNTFQTFSKSLAGAGDVLTLRFTSTADGASEAFAFRNILIEGLVESGGLTGDYNGDGTVDLADYAVWRDSLGTVVDAGTGADGSGNSEVDAADYTVWKENFRLTNGSTATTLASVPEPQTLLTVVVFLSCFLACRRPGNMAA